MRLRLSFTWRYFLTWLIIGPIICHADSIPDSTSFDWLPASSHSSQFDIQGEYICVIPAADNDHTAVLFNRRGEKVFMASDSGEGRYWYVSADPRLVLLGWSQVECFGYFDIFNYSGQKRTRLEDIEGLLGHSPNGAYYHTNFDPLLCSVQPELYDNSGQRVSWNPPQSSTWNMISISDSVVLYNTGDSLFWCALPDVAILRKLELPLPHESYVVGFQTTISDDGSVYAYDAYGGIVICRTGAEQIYIIDKSELDNFRAFDMAFYFWLDLSGDYLIYLKSGMDFAKVTVFKFADDQYRKIIDWHNIPFKYPGEHIFRDPLFHDSLCAFNFVGRSKTGHRFRSFLFSFLTPDHIAAGVTLDRAISRMDTLGCMTVKINDPDSELCIFRQYSYDDLFSDD